MAHANRTQEKNFKDSQKIFHSLKDKDGNPNSRLDGNHRHSDRRHDRRDSYGKDTWKTQKNDDDSHPKGDDHHISKDKDIPNETPKDGEKTRDQDRKIPKHERREENQEEGRTPYQPGGRQGDTPIKTKTKVIQTALLREEKVRRTEETRDMDYVMDVESNIQTQGS